MGAVAVGRMSGEWQMAHPRTSPTNKLQSVPARWRYAFPFDPCPPPDRDPDRRRLELPRTPFLDPVPDGPGRLALFFDPVDPRPDVSPLERGAFVFDPVPLPPLLRASDIEGHLAAFGPARRVPCRG